MHNHRRFVLLPILIAAAAVWCPLPAQAAEKSAAAGVLQVRVSIPPTPSPTAQDRVGERFVDAMADVFRGRGYTGKVERVDELDEPRADAPLLSVNLTEWERGPAGNIHCRLAATLEAGGHQRSLGTFDGTALGLAAAPGRFGASQAFDDAAAQALRSLYDALAKTELIVGLRKK